MKKNVVCEHPYKVGDVAFADLGWNRSLPAFYQVLDVTPKTIIVRRLATRVISDDGYGQNGYVMPRLGEVMPWDGKPMRRKADRHGYFSVGYYGIAHPWDGNAKEFTSD